MSISLAGKGVSKGCRQPQGPLIKVFGVSIDAYCRGGFNETIGGRVRLRRPEITLILLKVVFWWSLIRVDFRSVLSFGIGSSAELGMPRTKVS
jgi:hypothetical protein